MDLDQFISLEPAAFKKLIEDGYLDDHGIWIVDIYNALIVRAAEHPAHVEQLAASAVDAYLGSGLLNEAILYLELQARALLTQHKLNDAVVLVERIAESGSDRTRSRPAHATAADSVSKLVLAGHGVDVVAG